MPAQVTLSYTSVLLENWVRSVYLRTQCQHIHLQLNEALTDVCPELVDNPTTVIIIACTNI